MSGVALAVLFLPAIGFTAPPTPDNAGLQLNRDRENLERERLRQQIIEDQERGKEDNVTDKQDKQGKLTQNENLRFLLEKITTDDSEILTAERFNALAAPYIGKEVAIDDLMALVDQINEFYSREGYITCRAYLKPQTIKSGTVHISLSEGRTGTVTLTGNKSTHAGYVYSRLHLKPGVVQNINELNKDLAFFNGTHDAQLKITLQAGAEPGTTDYAVVLKEPQRTDMTLYVNNDGQESTGRWQTGAFFRYRSLTRNQDDFTIGGMHSTGLNSLTLRYDIPTTARGPKISFDYSTNGTKTVKGPWRDRLKGHASSFGMTFTQPISVSYTNRSEASLGYRHQTSTNTFAKIFHLVDYRVDGVTAAFTQTNYSRSSVYYQRYAYTVDHWKNDVNGERRDVSLGRANAFYHHRFKGGQTFFSSFFFQWAPSKELPSSEKFNIGGAGNIRGYEENLLSGTGGFVLSTEYGVPLEKSGMWQMFGFLDGGKVYEADDYIKEAALISTGLGIRYQWRKNISASLTVGFPLRREINETTCSRSRIHFTCVGRF
ncbi:Hemolysin activation/secretion protein [Selenomonas ruminantium]|uniref:Hemolysin activation/secretion protein n=1 Tax=Selenomonas ruminantium TaxID=971 RepID=A0A1M6R776_SELRU|nr:ShlB/FhaC/HecB family hemolysin secretion/activation protein [Selenomonas ruminantium]SHK28341.1 Hemolysin activation/secretion protein [Selenomonas ruminantium]